MSNIEINNITGPIELSTKDTICLNDIKISGQEVDYMPGLFDRTALEYRGDLGGRSLRFNAFAYRYKTQIIDLKNVNSIHRSSFLHMNALKELYLRNDTKVSITGNGSLFSYIDANGNTIEYIPTIYVPSNLFDEYTKDSYDNQWRDFRAYIQRIPEQPTLKTYQVNSFILDSNQKIKLNTSKTYCENNYKIEAIQRDQKAQDYLTNNFTSYVDTNNQVKVLEPYALGYRSELKKVDLGTNLIEIQKLAFFNPLNKGTSLTTVIIRNSNQLVNLISPGVFDLAVELHPTTFAIYVPENLIDEYKNASNWVVYKNYIKSLLEYKGE